jgi:glycolate oxidase iron-sulfur subunit
MLKKNEPMRNLTSTKCAKCGACTVVCPIYQKTGKESYTARGRLHLFTLLKKNRSWAYGDILSKCLLCGACADVCPRGIDVPSIIRKTRYDFPKLAGPLHFKKLLTTQILASPHLLDSLGKLQKNLLSRIPRESGLRKLLPFPESTEGNTTTNSHSLSEYKNLPNAHVSYFTGCMALYLSPTISSSTIHLAEKATGNAPTIPSGQTCCGLASYSSGNMDEAKKLARRNIRAFSDSLLPILTSCASCYTHLRSYPDLLADDPDWIEEAKDFAQRVREFSSFFLSRIDQLSFAQSTSPPRIFYHDPCHLRFGVKKIHTAPRRLITVAAGSSPLELPHGPRCCGQGGLFSLAHPTLSQQIQDPLLDEISELSALQVVTTCSGCLMQLMEGAKKNAVPTQVQHLGILLHELLEL